MRGILLSGALLEVVKEEIPWPDDEESDRSDDPSDQHAHEEREPMHESQREYRDRETNTCFAEDTNRSYNNRTFNN